MQLKQQLQITNPKTLQMHSTQKSAPNILENPKNKKAVISVTDVALDQIKSLLLQRGKDSFGIRIGVKSGGCSGLSYYVEYADEPSKFDEVIEVSNVRVLIDPKALMYLIGSEMDYSENEFKSGFIFVNPNERNKCGCGKSFNV
jgi:iron-sulfur cluster assembly protein